MTGTPSAGEEDGAARRAVVGSLPIPLVRTHGGLPGIGLLAYGLI